MICPECGTTMAKGSRFCHQCGWDSKLAGAGKEASTAGHRPAWKRWVMGITLGAASLLLLGILLVPRSDAETVLQVGQAAPDFELESVEGEQIKLSDLKGQPVILNFWATWCPPCRREMPDFQQVYDQHHEQGLQLFGINVGESKVAVADFRDRVGVSFPILIDSKETAQTAYKIMPLPATYFIDRDGVIRGVYPFQMTRAQIEDEVKRLLAR